MGVGGGGKGRRGGGEGLEQGPALDLVAVLAAGELLHVLAVLGRHERSSHAEINKLLNEIELI